jgi:SRSO17 transposase
LTNDSGQAIVKGGIKEIRSYSTFMVTHWTEIYEKTPLAGDLENLSAPVVLHKVDETKREIFWDQLVREHHYLGYDSVIGCRVKYLITVEKKLVGAISFCSAAYQLGLRDKFIGWDEKTRLKFLPRLLNNNRFLILPWINIHNLASHVLALSLKRVRFDWEQQYDVEPYMVETFVDRERYTGTCYLAANWTYLGITKGYGKIGKNFIYHGREKDFYVYIINRRFRNLFRPNIGRLSSESETLLKMTINSIPMFRNSILKEIGVEDLDSTKFNELLEEHLKPYIPFLGRKEHVPHFTSAIKGLLSNLERKSIEPIAHAFEGIDETRNLANFFTRSLFDDQGMQKFYQMEAGKIISHRIAMLTGDECDFLKKGNNSVGVARQYCGPLGKVENCQAGVFIGYVSPEGYALADYEMYMPGLWFNEDHFDLRKRLHVPEELKFATKNQILSRMISKAVNSGSFKGKYVGVDCSFGRDHAFLDSLPENLIYFADVPYNHQVFTGCPDIIILENNGKGEKHIETTSFSSSQVKDIAVDPSYLWNDVVLGIGSKGPIIAKDKCIKVVESRDGKPGKEIWLYVRKLEDGSIKYALCNESIDASPEMVRVPALMRWSIEQCFRECKKYLGMDHYEVRSWPGWRRHILFTLIAHLFIIKLRKMFSAKADTPGPAPVILSPVSLEEYRNAVSQAENNQPIKNPMILAFPEQPQQVMTIGLIKTLIQSFLPKIGIALDDIKDAIKKSTSSYESYAREKIRKIKEMADPPINNAKYGAQKSTL